MRATTSNRAEYQAKVRRLLDEDVEVRRFVEGESTVLPRFLTGSVEEDDDMTPEQARQLEAVYKALQELPNCRGVGWRDIEVSRNESGKPSVSLSGLAAAAADANGPLRIHLSLTHTHTSAAAVAVIERRGAAR